MCAQVVCGGHNNIATGDASFPGVLAVSQTYARRCARHQTRCDASRGARSICEKVKALHPDKGGAHTDFCKVSNAYRALMADHTDGRSTAPSAPKRCTLGRAQLPNARAKQAGALCSLQLEECDAGSTNINENGSLMNNQCFYLSLARSYLGEHAPELINETALGFKRAIEAAVLLAHPGWAHESVGENLQAFNDFLVYGLAADSLLAHFSVAVFDKTTGGVELYMGKSFPGPEHEAEQRGNFLTIAYSPGHFRAIIPRSQASRPTPTQMLQRLSLGGMPYVTTDAEARREERRLSLRAVHCPQCLSDGSWLHQSPQAVLFLWFYRGC